MAERPPGRLYIRCPTIPPTMVPTTAPIPNTVTAKVPASTVIPFCQGRGGSSGIVDSLNTMAVRGGNGGGGGGGGGGGSGGGGGGGGSCGGDSGE
jgi:hypothetical protein